VHSRLGGAVSRGECERNKGEAGGYGHDGGVGLLLEMREQRGGEPDWAEEVGGDDGLGVSCVCGLR